MSFWRVVGAVLRRDLRAEFRRKEIFTTVVMFGLLTVTLFQFAFDPARHPRETVLPGALWTAFLFAGMLGLNRSAAKDSQDGCMAGVATSPADRGALYLGKLIGHAIFMAAGEIMVLVPAIVWFDLDARHLTGEFFALVGLGTLGFLTVGTVFAVIGQKTRLREVMLPVLLLPVLLPMVMASVEGMAIVLDPNATASMGPWFQLLAGYDVVFFTAGFLLYGFVLEE